MADFNTAQLEYMLAKGLTLADAIEISKLGKRRNANAERQARWRARKSGNSATEGVTNNVTDNALPPPIDNHTPPVSSNDETTPLPKAKRVQAQPPAKPADVSEPVWRDFIRHRAKKRADVSDTVVAGIRREANLAGWTMEDALSETVTRGWQAFKAEWVEKAPTAQADDFMSHLQSKRRVAGVPSG